MDNNVKEQEKVEKKSNPLKMIIICVLFFCIGIGIAIITDDSNNQETNKDGDNNQTEQLDQLVGKWYKYDRDGFRLSDSYIEIDGEGHFKSVTAGYIFHEMDKDYYVIDGENITFYNEDGTEWRSCDLKSSNEIWCYPSSIEVYKR